MGYRFGTKHKLFTCIGIYFGAPFVVIYAECLSLDRIVWNICTLFGSFYSLPFEINRVLTPSSIFLRSPNPNATEIRATEFKYKQ